MPLFLSSGKLTQFPPAGRLFPGAAEKVKNIEVAAVPNRPAHSPIWNGVDINVAVQLAQNTETGVYTALIGVSGKKRVAFESTDRAAAIDGAIVAYASVVETRIGRPAITAQDKADVAANFALWWPIVGN